MVSEGSCDTEDWSNDAKISFDHLHFKIYSNTNISQHYFCCILDQRNAGLESRKTFLNSKNSKNLTVQKRLTVRVAILYTYFTIL